MDARLPAALVLDHVVDRRTDLIALSAQSQQTFVDLRVCIHEPGGEEPVPAIASVVIGRGTTRRTDRLDSPQSDLNVDHIATWRDRILKQHGVSLSIPCNVGKGSPLPTSVAGK